MARKKNKRSGVDWKEVLNQDGEFLREIVQEVLEAEMDEAVGARKGERNPTRKGYRSGYYLRGVVTRVGKLELRVPRVHSPSGQACRGFPLKSHVVFLLCRPNTVRVRPEGAHGETVSSRLVQVASSAASAG